VHLVWGPLGIAPLRRFLASYSEHPAGVEHELVLALNHVDTAQRRELERELDGVDCTLLALPAPVQDLAAYFDAAARLEHEQLCFLNSYAELLAPAWLRKLTLALERPDAGLAGATGSWASPSSATLNALFLPNAYRPLILPRRIARVVVQEMERDLARERDPDAEAARAPVRPRLVERIAPALRALPAMAEQLACFARFPNEHLRTNAFMASRETLLALEHPAIDTKMRAYRLESGRSSITRQVQRLGLRALVVDRDGVAYSERDWPASVTLWQGAQQGLLVADNQTRLYGSGDADRRRLLATFAWGPQAAPEGPPQP
jgi:hypothetical protein